MSTTDTGQKSAIASGSHAPVTAQKVPDVDPSDPPEAIEDALEAEDFIVYGKASIEKFDSGGQNSDTPEILDLSPDAIESALDRFFESEKAPGIISIGHDDIPVGKPLREFELDEATEIEVGGDTYSFDAGDTLETHVVDADGDGQPELWMLGSIAKDTDIARKARMGVLMGELDGYSVTFGRRDVEPEGAGQRVTKYDLFSVTLAPEDMVANEGSEFDLAAFKAQFADYQTQATDDATNGLTRVAEALESAINTTMSDSTEIDEDTLLKRLGQKLTGADGDETDEQTTDDGGDADAGQKEDDDGSASVDDLVAALADKLGEDPEDLMQLLSQNAEDEPDPDDSEEEEDDEADMETAQKGGDDTTLPDGVLTEDDIGEKLAEHGVVTEDDLESFRESVVDDLGQKLAETNKEAVEDIAQKMTTGETPTPAGGSFQDSKDFESHLKKVADGEGW